MAEWIAASAASRTAGVSDRTIRNWIAKGKIIAKKEKNRWLVDDSSIRKVGNDVSSDSGKAETVTVPLEHYDGLVTRLGQLEAENQQYRRLLEDKRRRWWRRWFRKRERE